MKYLLFLVLLIPQACAIAQDNASTKREKEIYSPEKLKITGKSHYEPPYNSSKDWMTNYAIDGIPIENSITILVEFDYDNVEKVLILDTNARDKLCTKAIAERYLYLEFEPTSNVKKITTRIHTPCFENRVAKFELRVLTADGNSYYNFIRIVPVGRIFWNHMKGYTAESKKLEDALK